MKPLPFEQAGAKARTKTGHPRSNKQKSERAKLISRIVAYSDTNNPRCAKTVLKLIEDTRSFILKIDLEKRKVMKNGKISHQLKMKSINGSKVRRKGKQR